MRSLLVLSDWLAGGGGQILRPDGERGEVRARLSGALQEMTPGAGGGPWVIVRDNGQRG